MSNGKRFSSELRERAVRMVVEHGKDHDSQWGAIRSIS
jgi:transposase